MGKLWISKWNLILYLWCCSFPSLAYPKWPTHFSPRFNRQSKLKIRKKLKDALLLSLQFIFITEFLKIRHYISTDLSLWTSEHWKRTFWDRSVECSGQVIEQLCLKRHCCCSKAEVLLTLRSVMGSTPTIRTLSVNKCSRALHLSSSHRLALHPPLCVFPESSCSLPPLLTKHQHDSDSMTWFRKERI